jgi:serine/threonine-protein kinase
MRFSINLSAPQRLVILNQLNATSSVAISPDGRYIAFVATQGVNQELHLRPIDSDQSRAIPGTDGASGPLFSPDGHWVAFTTPGGSYKLSTSGGAVATIAPPGTLANGAYWGEDGLITYGSPSGLQQISDAGGTPRPLTQLAQIPGSINMHRMPYLLPEGRGALFVGAMTAAGIAAESRIMVAPGDGSEPRTLVPAGTTPRYAPSGHLVYAQGGTLFAAPFDLETLSLTREPVPVLQGVLQTAAGHAYYSLSNTGTLTYLTGESEATNNLVWVTRNGTEHLLMAPPRQYDWPRLAPDGRRIAVEVSGQTWIYDTARDTLTRLTFAGAQNDGPTWTPDGTHVAVRSNREGVPAGIFWQRADGSGGDARLTTPTQAADLPLSFSPDGTLLAFIRTDPKTQRDIWVQSLDDQKRTPFLVTAATEGAARFSPDGRWIAYVSNESSRPEIYVQPYPGPGGKWQISTDGGIEPAWNPNGRELFYRSGRRMMAVPVMTQPTFSAGRPTQLFEGDYLASVFPLAGVTYDVTRDGQRFLMVKQNAASATQVNVVINWFEELRRLVPVN